MLLATGCFLLLAPVYLQRFLGVFFFSHPFPFPPLLGECVFIMSVPSAGRVAWFREKKQFLGKVQFPLYKGPSAGVDIASPL